MLDKGIKYHTYELLSYLNVSAFLVVNVVLNEGDILTLQVHGSFLPSHCRVHSWCSLVLDVVSNVYQTCTWYLTVYSLSNILHRYGLFSYLNVCLFDGKYYALWSLDLIFYDFFIN